MNENKRQSTRSYKRKKIKRKESERLKRNSASKHNNNKTRVINRRFNREEMTIDNLYYDNYGWAPRQNHSCSGWIKCRMLHGLGYSLIIPDQIFIDHGGLKWIQPLAFSLISLFELDNKLIILTIFIDISCGNNIQVRLSSGGYIKSLLDGSQLFHCEIIGPKNLYEYATGEAEWGADNIPYIRLFHHTTTDSYNKITASSHFRTGPYNIQGTTKRLTNVAYAYFTPLDKINTHGDLRKIAMAPEGVIQLRRDNFTPPFILPQGWQELYKGDILQLDVYPCDQSKRQAFLEVWIDSTVLAPQHIYQHDEGGPVYYEIPHAFIQRIGMEPGNNVLFDSKKRIHRQKNLKAFKYVVVGDCRTIAGLKAPYDEEDTTNIMKIEEMPQGQNLLNFWFDNRNSDLYSEKAVELQTFGK